MPSLTGEDKILLDSDISTKERELMIKNSKTIKALVLMASLMINYVGSSCYIHAVHIYVCLHE